MMVAIFTTLSLALVLRMAPGVAARRLATTSLVGGLALTIGLFLWEIYSPDYGFRMPWLQAMVAPRL